MYSLKRVQDAHDEIAIACYKKVKQHNKAQYIVYPVKGKKTIVGFMVSLVTVAGLDGKLAHRPYLTYWY